MPAENPGQTRGNGANVAHRPITDDDRIKMAIAKYTTNENGELPTWARVAVDFDRDEGVVRDAVKTAFRRRLVRIVGRRRSPLPCPRHSELESCLKRRYRQLRSVIVLDTTQLGGLSGPQLDDEIHRSLGREAAKIIAEGWVFKDGDVIGVGAGRGVYYTVDELSVLAEPMFCENIKIVSMTGSVEARNHMADLAFHMDADLHALNLMRCFTGATAEFIAGPITPAERNHTILGPDKWQRCRPNHALVGVGVLASGHRFYEEVRGPEPRSILRPLREDLTTLVDCCANIETHVGVDGYAAVGDLCHQLFFIDPPANGKPVGKGLRENIEKLIDQINSCTLTVSEAQLQSIENITVIAGTARKGFALAALLNSHKYHIHHMCTDSTAAQAMLGT